MKEKDIQNYLFENTDFLFPKKTVQEKAKEYSIKGKRIDLLFRVDGIRYIVEIKNKPLKREHIGQVVEYYGLMKTYLNEANLKMILVSPIIEEWQKVYLAELGINCIVFNKVLSENEINDCTFSSKNKPKEHSLQFVKYWFVSVEFKQPLRELADRQVENFKHLLKNQDSKLNVVSFPNSHSSMFVQKAKVGDYIMVNINQNGRFVVYPPREILYKDVAGSQTVFYVEKSSEHLKQILNFDEFLIKLKNTNKDISVSKTSIRPISKKHLNSFISVWQK